MLTRLSGRRIVVTGASSGIGRETARLLAAQGASVLAIGRDAEELAEAAAGGPPMQTLAADISRADGQVAVVERAGPIHRIVNDAGVGWVGLLVDMPGGHIVNIGSILGLAASPPLTVYSATKFGVHGFSEGLRHELAGPYTSQKSSRILCGSRTPRTYRRCRHPDGPSPPPPRRSRTRCSRGSRGPARGRRSPYLHRPGAGRHRRGRTCSRVQARGSRRREDRRYRPEDVTAPFAIVLVADPYSYSEWVLGTKKIESADEDWPAPGTAFYYVAGLGPFRMGSSTVSRDVERPRRLEMEADAKILAARVALSIRPWGEGSLVVLEEHWIHGPNLLLGNPLIDLALNIRNRMMVRNLAVLVERRIHAR